MPKIAWTSLVETCRAPHAVEAILPDSFDEDVLGNVQASLRLMMRLLARLPLAGEYAVTVHRQGGRPEVVCAFREAIDAGHVAEVTGSTPRHDRGCWAGRYSFVLDESSEGKLLEIAGPPEMRRQPLKSRHGN